VPLSAQVTCNCMSGRKPQTSIFIYKGCIGGRGGGGGTGEEQSNNLPEQKMMQIIWKYRIPIGNPQEPGWF
jgi:hypothetical protein